METKHIWIKNWNSSACYDQFVLLKFHLIVKSCIIMFKYMYIVVIIQCYCFAMWSQIDNFTLWNSGIYKEIFTANNKQSHRDFESKETISDVKNLRLIIRNLKLKKGVYVIKVQ